MRLRYVLICGLALAIAVAAWYVWHVSTVDLPLITAPADLVELPRPTLEQRPLPIWIDTDAACGTGSRRDVDDCWAIATILRSPELAVRGISTVFGNTDAAAAARVATSVCQHFGSAVTPVVGAEEPGQHVVAAVESLAQALRREKLLILSLGPATNLAAAVREYPALRSQIAGIIAVAGATDAAHFELGRSRVFHAHDQNFRRDVDSFQALLDAGLPMVLIPYDTVSSVSITSGDFKYLENNPSTRWLAHQSREWLEYWSELSGTPGFIPFDLVATGFAVWPTQFEVTRLPIQIRRPVSHAPEQFLVSSPAFSRGWVISYATAVDPQTKTLLLERLAELRR